MLEDIQLAFRENLLSLLPKAKQLGMIDRNYRRGSIWQSLLRNGSFIEPRPIY